jgi:cell division septum initiation protein DivIVA
MSVEKLQDAVQMLRTVELRPAVRGVDPEQVRQFLDEAAELLAAAAREQKELRSEVARVREANDETAVGKALVTATRAGEAVIAEAREEAASLSAEAEAQASALLGQVKAQAEKREQETKAAREQFEQELTDARQAHAKELELARADADAALTAARGELAQLERQAAQLSSLVADMERRIVEIAQDALEELETFGASAGSPGDNNLLADLRPAAERSDVSSG